MNTTQLKNAADTVAVIGEHMDMKDVGGNILAILGSTECGMMHVITTDRNPDEVINLVSDAMCAAPEAADIILKAVTQYFDKKDAAMKVQDSTDPTTELYWDDNYEAAQKFANETEDRQKIFNQFDEHEQAIFWAIEDALCALKQAGDFDGTVCQVRDILDAIFVRISRAKVEEILKVAKCKLDSRPGRTTLCDTAQSIFRLNS